MTPPRPRKGGAGTVWRRATVRILFVIGLLAEVGAIAVLWTTLPKPEPRTVTGSARCSSGAPVVGVWVEGRSGGSWWADDFIPKTTDPSTASFVKLLPHGGQYQVRVGCGGTRADWRTTNYSQYVDEGHHDFICDDPNTREIPGTCR